jgi:nucleoside-diphosphate-sugar epimerase
VRILVTGASGFVGRQIVRALLVGGHEVVAMTRGVRIKTVETVVADFLHPQQRLRALEAARAQIVIHAAWYVEHGNFWHANENRLWYEHSVRFIDEAKQLGITRFVGLGTCYEYAWPTDGICDESTTPTAVHTPYDEAKSMTCEYLAAQDDAAFSTVWARLFLLYGDGEGPKRLAPSVARALLRGGEAACSAGTALRDFMDVRDAGTAIAAVALSSIRGAMNVASGEALRVADFALAIGEELACPERVKLGALPERADEPPAIVARVERLRAELGFIPSFTLREGIRDFCKLQRECALVDSV